MSDTAGVDELSGMMAYVSGVVAPLLQERSKLRRGVAGMSGVGSGVGGISERGSVGGSRRLSHDVDRRAMTGVSGSSVGGDSVMDYSHDMHSDDSEDDEEDDDNAVETSNSNHNSEKDSSASSVGGMTAGQYLHQFSTATSDDTLSATMRSILAEASSFAASSTSASASATASAASSKRSSLTSLPALPPVPAVRQGSAARSSFVSNPSFSPQLSPSSSPPASYATRHLPRSAASARSTAPTPAACYAACVTRIITRFAAGFQPVLLHILSCHNRSIDCDAATRQHSSIATPPHLRVFHPCNHHKSQQPPLRLLLSQPIHNINRYHLFLSILLSLRRLPLQESTW